MSKWRKVPVPCLHRRCPALVWEAGASRCPEHGGKRSPSSQATQTAEHRRARRAMIAALPLPCHLCGGAILTAEDLHVDHVEPAMHGGQTRAPAHAACNLRKGARSSSEPRHPKGDTPRRHRASQPPSSISRHRDSGRISAGVELCAEMVASERKDNTVPRAERSVQAAEHFRPRAKSRLPRGQAHLTRPARPPWRSPRAARPARSR